jgi:hypothetical protein
MRKMECFLAAVLLSQAGLSQDVFAQSLLTNEAIVRMAKAGVSSDVIATLVYAKPGQYSVSMGDRVALRRAGVSDTIIGAMVSRSATTAAPSAASGAGLILHDGTPVKLRLTRNLSSADAKTGDKLAFEVLEDVKVDDTLVIARGATAIGTLTDAQAKRRTARGGKLDITIDYVRLVNDEKIALRGVKDAARMGTIVSTSLIVGDSTLPKDAEITAYVNGEFKCRPVEHGGSRAIRQNQSSE